MLSASAISIILPKIPYILSSKDLLSLTKSTTSINVETFLKSPLVLPVRIPLNLFVVFPLRE